MFRTDNTKGQECLGQITPIQHARNEEQDN